MKYSSASWAALLLIMTALGGCFGGDGAAPKASQTTGTSSSGTGGSGGSGGNGTGGGSGSSGGNGTAQPPAAAFEVRSDNASDSNLTAGNLLIFDASASMDPAGGPLVYSWNFGDGNTSSGQIVNHTYALGDNYSIVLNITSNASTLSSEAVKEISVLAGAAPLTYYRQGTTDRVYLCNPDEYHYFSKKLFEGGSFKAEPSTLKIEWWTQNSTRVLTSGAEGEIPANADNFGVCPSDGVPPLGVGVSYKITLTSKV